MSQFDSAESAVDVAKIISDADHWTKEDTAKFAKAASGCIIDNKSVTAYEDNGEYTIPLPNAGYYLVVDATENNGVDTYKPNGEHIKEFKSNKNYSVAMCDYNGYFDWDILNQFGAIDGCIYCDDELEILVACETIRRL